ncbi:MAG TPA: hypothetical protein VIG76_12665 [Amnibacterium sp.]|jgi:hypothetical protein|uniref:hypothetical protein n=1 Tax=Amnibacterium sp. TaxID=1872496 RepID=UPI002F942D63
MQWFRDDVDSTLTAFFATRRRGCAGRRLAAVDRAEQLLRDCVEAVADAVLPPEARVLVEAERQFGADGAAARIASPETLLAVLPSYVADERWRPAHADERRAQVLAASALLRHLVAVLPPADRSETIHAAASAIEAAALRIRSDARLTP